MIRDKNIIITIAIGVIFYLLGCGNPYIGEKVHPSRTYGIYSSIPGHHIVKTKIVILEYDYEVDPAKEEIAFAGKMSFKKEAGYVQSERIKDFTLIVLFENDNLEVLKTKTVYLAQVKNTYDTFPFRFTLPYEEEYSYVSYLYKFTYYK